MARGHTTPARGNTGADYARFGIEAEVIKPHEDGLRTLPATASSSRTTGRR